MEKKRFILYFFLVSISLLGIVTISQLILATYDNNIPDDKAQASPPFSIGVSNQNVSVSQGESASANITLTSVYFEDDIPVYFSIKLIAYENWTFSSIEQSPFIDFDPNPLVLKYQEPNTVFLTITAEEDTPLGRYTFTIYFEGISSDGPFWVTVIQ